MGFQKILVFLLFIGIGFILKSKFSSKAEIAGLKKIILNLALPATIFIALLSVDINKELLLFPVMALALNGILYLSTSLFLPILGMKKGTPNYNTARLLFASLAPGLSCFPFVLEFLGESYLAKVAMADLGNKVFVLIILYLIAMQWYLKNNAKTTKFNTAKLLDLLKTLAFEPVNLFIMGALVLMAFGLHLENLPFVFSDILSRISLLMTPLVLLFIGLAVNIKKNQFAQLFSLLSIRAAISFLLIGILALIIPMETNTVLLALAFALSACSFWPYAHIASVDALELAKADADKTFNSNMAISILALSFPLSTILIMGVLNSGNLFSNTISLFIASVVLFVVGSLPVLFNKIPKQLLKLRTSKYQLKTYTENDS
ncbi:permease [Croceivirga lutea]|uniref:permease n=1 Tax=Croceivirga lutea TaxID=1775167 RepID=UPI00163B0AE2|nr:permease [Croceivirga lutea]